MKKSSGKKTVILFITSIALIFALFGTSVIQTDLYNRKVHHVTFAGEKLLTSEIDQERDVSVIAVPRSSTWGKIFDFHDEGLTENNYQAYTYDFTVANNTRDEVEKFSFKLIFDREVYLASAWNGALEIHQHTDGGELAETVPDLREFRAEDYGLKTVTVDGESFVAMEAGDYLIYIPSSSANAMEVPIEPFEQTTPGIIMYVAMEETISDLVLELEYSFHRVLTSVPLFWISLAAMAVWLIALLVFAITSAQIKKYQERHERDNEIINESIETFTGFIDAKDPYTNGHSKRVAMYTKLIAEKMGYEGEELDRIYYVALLHDCGKIGVPDSILGKPGKLTPEEFEIIKSHTVSGGEILNHFKSLKDVDEGALYHHERYDGKGYPEGRAGQDIPLIARMICVADSFDAMNSNRVYRKKLTKEYIINEIEQNKGKQFDPKIADIMLGLISDGKIVMED